MLQKNILLWGVKNFTILHCHVGLQRVTQQVFSLY